MERHAHRLPLPQLEGGPEQLRLGGAGHADERAFRIADEAGIRRVRLAAACEDQSERAMLRLASQHRTQVAQQGAVVRGEQTALREGFQQLLHDRASLFVALQEVMRLCPTLSSTSRGC